MTRKAFLCLPLSRAALRRHFWLWLSFPEAELSGLRAAFLQPRRAPRSSSPRQKERRDATGACAAALSTLPAGSHPAALKTSRAPRTRTSFYGKGSEAESTRSDRQAQGLGSRLHGAFVTSSGGYSSCSQGWGSRRWGILLCEVIFFLFRGCSPPRDLCRGWYLRWCCSSKAWNTRFILLLPSPLNLSVANLSRGAGLFCGFALFFKSGLIAFHCQ